MANASPRRHGPLLQHFALGALLIALPSAASGWLFLRLDVLVKIRLAARTLLMLQLQLLEGVNGLDLLVVYGRPRLFIKITAANADSTACLNALAKLLRRGGASEARLRRFCVGAQG